MKYRAEQKIRNQVLIETTIKEEQLFREVAFSIVKELPIDELKQLFNLNVIYGSMDALDKANKEGDSYKAEKVRELMFENSSLFTGEINTPDKLKYNIDMKRPEVKDYKNITGAGAYDYVADVNEYINHLEKQLKLLTRPVVSNCNGVKDPNIVKTYALITRKDGLTDVWCEGECLGEGLNTDGINKLNL